MATTLRPRSDFRPSPSLLQSWSLERITHEEPTAGNIWAPKLEKELRLLDGAVREKSGLGKGEVLTQQDSPVTQEKMFSPESSELIRCATGI